MQEIEMSCLAISVNKWTHVFVLQLVTMERCLLNHVTP